jgi:hypothetical protein
MAFYVGNRAAKAALTASIPIAGKSTRSSHR